VIGGAALPIAIADESAPTKGWHMRLFVGAASAAMLSFPARR
jgi:hypothetical protein